MSSVSLSFSMSTTAWAARPAAGSPSATPAEGAASAGAGASVTDAVRTRGGWGEDGAPGRGHHLGHHRAHRPDGDAGDGLRATLSLSVRQTLSDLMGATGGAATGAGTTTVAAPEGDDDEALSLDARFKLKLTDGQVRMKLSVELEGEGDGSQVAALMQGFVQTLQAALQTLFGRQGGSTPLRGGEVIDAVPAGGGATGGTTAPASGTGAPAPSAPAALASTTGAPATGAPAVGTTGADAAAPIGAPAAGSGSAGTTADATRPTATSLSLKLRLRYGDDELRLGALVRQLGQPQTATAQPDLVPLLQDLGAGFARLTAALGARGDAAPSLSTFLASLGQRLDGVGTKAQDAAARAALAPSPAGSTGRLLDLRA